MNVQAEAAARLEKLRGFLKMDPGNPSMLAECADLALQLGMPRDAATWTERALEGAPQDPYLLARLASAKIALGEAEPAIRLLEPLAAAHESEPAIRYNLGYAYMRAGRYAEAKEALAAIVDHPAAPASTRHFLARALHHLGELDEAIEHAREHAEAHPEDAMAAGTLSLLYFDAAELAEAKRWSERALAGQPDSLDALLAAGSVAVVNEDEEQAAQAFEKALKASPLNGRAWAGLGMVAMMKLDLTAARGYFEKALADMPGQIGAWNALAWCQMLQKDFAAAQASLERSLAINRNIADTHGALAALEAFQGRWQEADQHAKRALGLDPGSFAGQMAGWLKMQSAGKGQLALAEMMGMMRAHPAMRGGSIADMLGRTMAKRGVPAAAPDRPKPPA
jgi:tetratricopeptide (TPR) repeat protein